MKNIQIVLAIISLVTLALMSNFQKVFAEEEIFLPAESSGLIVNQTNISDNSFSGATGLIGVNMAAGDNSTQINARAITIGEGEPVISSIGVQQKIDTKSTFEFPSHHFDYIVGEAFAGSMGIISINQTAGSGSAQANLISIGIGLGVEDATPVSGDELFMSYGHTDIGSMGYDRSRADIVGGNAFSGSMGLVQVNQSAGSANRVLNTSAIRFEVITIP